MNYNRGRIKLRLELMGMAPFVWLGYLYGRLFPLKQPTTHFLFFPSADIGGSIRNNADIAACIKDRKPLVIFSKKPKNNGFRHLFQQEDVRVMDLHREIDNKLFHFVNFFYRGVLAAWINRSEDPVVFGGECIFFYKIIPHLKKEVRRVELCHLDTWLGYSIGFIHLITFRICSTLKLKEAILRQYRENNVPLHFYENVHFIENHTYIPQYREIDNPQLEVVFIGRGSPQKRVYLITAIAARAHEKNLPIRFSFAGDVENVVNPEDYPFCKFYGNVTDEASLRNIQQSSDVLLLTSAFEGLPMVVMEMMAFGKVVVSTAVNSIPDYITHMENGLLIRATEEDAIVEEGVELLRLLIAQPELKAGLGRRSMEIAAQKFSGEAFCREYRKVLIRKV
ncbi:MAG TPA: glycosyltransferase family 4 protein [Puia sp.]|nr:glycosyltransferase family 4 protein [Puia sp.]